jgi:hypothetical protein
MILCFNCSTRNVDKIPEFTFITKGYDSDNIERSEFYYDSETGKLKNFRPETDIINLSDYDKKNIYQYYKKLILKSNSCTRTFNDDIYGRQYYKDNIKFHNTINFKIIECDSSDIVEKQKFGKLFLYIFHSLQTKEEYKKAFPEEFYEY